MLVESSESRGSGQSRSVGKKVSGKPPFKLCFPSHPMSGRSELHASHIDTNFITPKFYSQEAKVKDNFVLNDTVEEMIKKENEKPQDVYRWPYLSSQSYGWWYNRGFGMRDRRFNHHKNTSEMVRSYDVIHWQDKKLQGLYH